MSKSCVLLPTIFSPILYFGVCFDFGDALSGSDVSPMSGVWRAYAYALSGVGECALYASCDDWPCVASCARVSGACDFVVIVSLVHP